MSLGQRIGFGTVVDHSDYSQIEPLQLPFFLMHYAISDPAKAQLLHALRRSPQFNVRFAPIILIMPDGPLDLVHYIEMGFDDVICLPEKAPILTARFNNQLGQEKLFIEAEGYLGPDRRRMAGGDAANRRTADTTHTRIIIVRQPGRGVSVLKRQLVLRGRSDAAPTHERASSQSVR
ncbi:hypothetical protein WH87_05310 [Devosia epidermidihirudinis]|uniref:Response regulatory domain-containing protein n=1 Tax=Devosia epidermidihirudinis TaxID=1293439 RepID=A0A0F5QF37_9HYPH|nr:hypothetical protein WH87_05310 [Devosia epidermidihirudinis]